MLTHNVTWHTKCHVTHTMSRDRHNVTWHTHTCNITYKFLLNLRTAWHPVTTSSVLCIHSSSWWDKKDWHPPFIMRIGRVSLISLHSTSKFWRYVRVRNVIGGLYLPRDHVIILCDYTIYGSKQTIHSLIRYNLKITVRQKFVIEVYITSWSGYLYTVLSREGSGNLFLYTLFG